MVQGGATALFYSVIYKKLLSWCENVYFRISLHLVGLFIMIFGIYFLITKTPLALALIGVFIFVWGLTFFIIPFGVRK